MTLVTTILLGIIYPLVVTGLAQVIFHDKANGQLIARDGKIIGSRIIGQAFSGPRYFHSRPSAAGNWLRRRQFRWLESRSHEQNPDRSREQDAAALQAENQTAGAGRPGHHVGFRSRS